MAFFVLLPTLIFEAAFNLDARALRENLTGVLTLAVPGLLLSTGLIAALMVLATPFGWLEAILLGSILSATEPVSVIQLLRKIGAPKRLTILVEGESLFNDATALVLAKIFTAILLTGAAGSATFLQGGVDFLSSFSVDWPLGGPAPSWSG